MLREWHLRDQNSEAAGDRKITMQVMQGEGLGKHGIMSGIARRAPLRCGGAPSMMYWEPNPCITMGRSSSDCHLLERSMDQIWSVAMATRYAQKPKKKKKKSFKSYLLPHRSFVPCNEPWRSGSSGKLRGWRNIQSLVWARGGLEVFFS